MVEYTEEIEMRFLRTVEVKATKGKVINLAIRVYVCVRLYIYMHYIPVSYTHLDVYKRQPDNAATNCICRFF